MDKLVKYMEEEGYSEKFIDKIAEIENWLVLISDGFLQRNKKEMI